MIKRFKIPLIVLGVVAFLVLGVGGYWLWLTRQPLPKTKGTLKVEGLNAPVEVVRDAYGVAHIYAQNPADLFFAQGFVHAQERFWQMEMNRRTGAGRMSEVLGEPALAADRYLRHLGFAQSAEKAYAMMDPEIQAVFEAYAAGVNAYISSRSPGRLGLEFSLLRLQGVRWEIEPWEPVDSLLWAYMMVYDQSGSPASALTNVARLLAVGENQYADLNPAYRSDRPVIVQSEDFKLTLPSADVPAVPALDAGAATYLLDVFQQASGGSDALAYLEEMGYQLNAGSNSFVVSGDLTETGKPILANDPHMGVQMPSLWYEVGMHCVEKTPDCPYRFRGYSLPGVPGVLIGHNDRIAWGLTNASFDVEDLFIERINPANPDQYEVNGEWVDMDIRYEEIQVRGRTEPVVLKIRYTRNGVIASDAMITQNTFAYTENGLDLFALSYAWTGLEPVRSAEAVQRVILSQNWEEFVASLAYFDAGKQNWIYADVDGNIGYVLPGRIPVRAGGDGTLPVPGWTDDYIWTGYIPYEHLPKVLNPKQGFIVTANNPQVRESEYPYLLSKGYDMGQRAARITDLIISDPDGISMADMQDFQTDNTNLNALEIIPYLKDLSFEDEALAAARDRLLVWDGDMTLESAEAALFNLFWAELIPAIFSDELPRNLPGAASDTSDVVYHLLRDPGNAWWDQIATPQRVEDRNEILTTAFEKAFEKGVKELGENLDKWQWGDLHTITFRHATLGSSGIGLIENIFNRGPFPTNGSESVPQKTCWRSSAPFTVSCIPAMRQVIDLGNLSGSWMIQSTGQSGHPVSSQYDDLMNTWRMLDYHPTNWARSEAEAGGQLLVLKP